MIIRITLYCFLFTAIEAAAQVGGRNIYEFLDLSPSARITGLGDYAVSVYDEDANLAYLNPASLNELSTSNLSFSQNWHFSDIVNGYFSYSHHLKKQGISIHGGVKYINYGEFDLADEFGNISGTFGASELAFTVGGAKALNENYSVGSNLKLVFSTLESYRSSGAVLDIGGMYRKPEKKFSAGFVIRNLGTQFTTYNELREPVPFDVVAGVSKQLEHLPLRFSLIAHHLHRWNITFDDPNLENNQLFTNSFATFVDNLARHLVFNGEFLIGKGAPLKLRFGYNHFRRRELSVTEFRSFGGFSGGLGIKAKKWRVDYGFNVYHLAGSVHHLTFGTSLNAFRKSREI